MDKDKNEERSKRNKKDEQLEKYRHKNTGPGKKMTEDYGVKVSNTQQTLRAGRRGPLLFEDFHFYKKQSHFNRERIPEKVVHARGFNVYGDFVASKSLKGLTKAHFLQEAGRKTPVVVRFSTFVGSKGSKDTAVDIRGFAVKFYTDEGNYDSLSLQFPVFLLADAMKFMDVTHAAKPNPKTDVPQATTAHNNFWDYVANNQESAHMVMWLMSMRGRPRSWRMMAGWPINTFRFINAEGKSTFVRFKWTPKLGVHSLLLDEANLIGGVDPDFHRRDIIEAIQKGVYPEYELGVQLINEEDEFNYDFDILDDTKLWPEEVIPVETIGTMTLNSLVDNFFAESEQSVFDPAHVVPGIDFTNDPVLQGRAFAYRDTELYRQHTANINNIPVNQSINEKNFNLRDSVKRDRIDVDSVHYHNNSLAENTPAESSFEEGGYVNYPEEVSGHVTREVPSDSFNDHFTQARMFFKSLSKIEQQDLTETLGFHIAKAKSESVRQQNVEMWANVDYDMACVVAERVGVNKPAKRELPDVPKYPSLSQMTTPFLAATQKVGVVIGDGFNADEVNNVLNQFKANHVFYTIISENLGYVTASDGTRLKVDENFTTTYPILYDSVYLVGGVVKRQALMNQEMQAYFKNAYKYFKPIGIASGARNYFKTSNQNNMSGVVFSDNNPQFARDFIQAIAKQRFWDRT
ncbi:catalase [Oceanobacillus sp. CAU 1775]